MRSYKQYCGVAKALDLVGQRWTLLLVRELLPGPRRFTELLLPGLTPNVLSERLKHLSTEGLLVRTELPPPAARKVWALTAEGRELEPVILALGAFGARHMGTPHGETMRARWLLFSLQRRWGGALDADVQVWAEQEPYRLHFEIGRLTVRDGVLHRPDLVLRGAPPVLADAFVRGEVGPDLGVDGDSNLLNAILAGLQQSKTVR